MTEYKFNELAVYETIGHI